jgi:hypothetical protein
MRTCTKCNRQFPETDDFFYRDKTKLKGLRPDCIECHKVKQVAYNAAHRAENNARNRRCRAKNGRTYDLRKLYGITAEQYDTMLNAQGGVCAICKQPPGNKRLAVDHDHSNGRNRALLCALCNHAIERFENDPDFGTKALNYLARYIEQTVKG